MPKKIVDKWSTKHAEYQVREVDVEPGFPRVTHRTYKRSLGSVSRFVPVSTETVGELDLAAMSARIAELKS